MCDLLILQLPLQLPTKLSSLFPSLSFRGFSIHFSFFFAYAIRKRFAKFLQVSYFPSNQFLITNETAALRVVRYLLSIERDQVEAAEIRLQREREREKL